MAFEYARSTGLMTTNLAANVPVPTVITGFDLVDGPGHIKLYDGRDANGVLMTWANAETFSTVEFGVPLRITNACFVYLENANAIIRYG